MIYRLEQITQPEIEAVSLAEARNQVRVRTSFTADDGKLGALIQGAREWAERLSGHVMIDEVWRLTLDFTARDPVGSDDVVIDGAMFESHLLYGIPLRRTPVIELLSVKSVDADGNETELQNVGSPPVSAWRLMEAQSVSPRIIPNGGTADLSGILRIEFRAGYANRSVSPQQGADAVPERLKQAMLLHIEAMYDRDEKMMPLLLDVAEKQLLPIRVDLGFA